jgi:hypothetical protein
MEPVFGYVVVVAEHGFRATTEIAPHNQNQACRSQRIAIGHPPRRPQLGDRAY